MGVYKVYSGKKGCMCGCRGKYSYTAEGAVKDNPEYVHDINERSVKIIMGKLLRDANTVKFDNMLVLEKGERVLVAYFD